MKGAIQWSGWPLRLWKAVGSLAAALDRDGCRRGTTDRHPVGHSVESEPVRLVGVELAHGVHDDGHGEFRLVGGRSQASGVLAEASSDGA